MSETVIVMVYDQDSAKHGEITVTESHQKASRLVETLLEAGFERERIRVYTGGELEMQVTHRPVVALRNSDSPVDANEAIDVPAEPDAEPEPALPRAKTELQEVEAAAAPGLRDGVRFSSLFRPA